jgi:hypothetical protein
MWISPVRVEEHDPHIGDGPADGGCFAAGVAFGEGRGHRVFGRTVGIDELSTGGPAVHQLGRAGLSGDEDGLQIGQGLERLLGQHRRGQDDVRDPELPHDPDELEAAERGAWRRQAKRRPDRERREHVRDGRVEARRREL